MEIRVIIKGTVMAVWLSAAKPLRGGDKIFIKRPALRPKDRFQRPKKNGLYLVHYYVQSPVWMFYFSLDTLNES